VRFVSTVATEFVAPRGGIAHGPAHHPSSSGSLDGPKTRECDDADDQHLLKPDVRTWK